MALGDKRKVKQIDEGNKDEKNKDLKINVDEIDLGDADGSSGNLGVDNFKRNADKDKLPSQKGRIEEL